MGGECGRPHGILSRAGSAWNAAGTYEERDVSEWAVGELKRRLLADVGTDACSVHAVSEVEGSASIVSARGKTKRPFDLKVCAPAQWAVAAHA